jgi:hypothetical protein
LGCSKEQDNQRIWKCDTSPDYGYKELLRWPEVNGAALYPAAGYYG